ncbi:DUF222 domain-containing protein [Tsukamurella ocularis]|uniref:DUF222 domain-containing protein n=1 Tax=Tsukamurella ocularis TaxID=1970234 RepID=UPI0039F07273
MDLPSGLRELPGYLLPPELADAAGFQERTADVLFEQGRRENLAFCRTITTLYSLYRTVYADAEAEYLGLPAADVTDRELLARRKDLRLREIALNAQVSTRLRLGPDAADRALTEAVGFIERLPRVFTLVGENCISVRAGQEALRWSRVLTGEQARRFDELIAERLRRDPLELLAIPAVREAADRIVEAIDPHAAEKRRKRAREDRTVVFRAEDDGMAAAYALLPAEDVLEIDARVEEIIETVCDHDPRTIAQKRADGLTARVRGSITLGCKCDQPGCPYREERRPDDGSVDGAIIRYRTLIHVVINETTLAGRSDDAGYLVGHGPVTAGTPVTSPPATMPSSANSVSASRKPLNPSPRPLLHPTRLRLRPMSPSPPQLSRSPHQSNRTPNPHPHPTRPSLRRRWSRRTVRPGTGSPLTSPAI